MFADSLLPPFLQPTGEGAAEETGAGLGSSVGRTHDPSQPDPLALPPQGQRVQAGTQPECAMVREGFEPWGRGGVLMEPRRNSESSVAPPLSWLA